MESSLGGVRGTASFGFLLSSLRLLLVTLFFCLSSSFDGLDELTSLYSPLFFSNDLPFDFLPLPTLASYSSSFSSKDLEVLKKLTIV